MDFAKGPTNLGQMISVIDLLDVPVFVMQHDVKRGYVLNHVNPSYERQTGLTRAGSVGRALVDVLPPRLAEKVIRNFQACEEVGAPITYEELLELDGREAWWKTTLTPLAGDGGTSSLIVGVAADITASKLAELQAAGEIARLSQHYDELRALAGLAAHDLRAPMANIVMMNLLVLNEFQNLSDHKRFMIEKISNLARSCMDTVEMIMNKITATEPAMAIDTHLDLGHLCRDVAALVDPNHTIVINAPEALVNADKIVLQVALRNLLDNAKRHCTSRVDVEIDPLRARPGTIVLTVSDDGPGLPAGFSIPDQMRAPLPTDMSKSGFGLDAIARLLKSRGGSISIVDEAPLSGACFEVILPGAIVNDFAVIAA